MRQLRCEAHDAAMELDWCSTRVTHYGETQAHLAHCAYAHCTHAGSKCVWLYDGSKDGIFNLSGSEMFTHHFLANLSDQIYLGGTPFHARAQQMLEQEGRVTDDDAQNMVSEPLLIEAFFGYVDLLTDLPKPCCDICGQYPMGLIVDGTGLAVFQERLQKLKGFTHPSGATVPATKVSQRTGEGGGG